MANKDGDVSTAEQLQTLMAELEAAKAEAAAAKAAEKAAKAEAEKAKAELENALEKHSDEKPHGMAAPATVDDGDEMVEVKLFKDGKSYKDDLVVGVNGRFIRIKRGVPVRIKKKFWRVIEQHYAQDAATAELIDRKTAEFEAETSKYE